MNSKANPTVFGMFGRFSLLAVGGISVVLAVLPIGTDQSHRMWLSAVLLPAGILLVFLSLRKHPVSSLGGRDLLGLLMATILGVLASAVVNQQFGGGDAWHSWRGFPYRWLIGATVGNPADAQFSWSFFWAGLVIDGYFWMVVGLSLLMLWRLMRRRSLVG